MPALAERTGPFLWQLPATFRYDEGKPAAFLEALTTTTVPDLPLRQAFEVRHESFRTPGFSALLRHHGVALVLSDPVVRAPFDAMGLLGRLDVSGPGDPLPDWGE